MSNNFTDHLSASPSSAAPTPSTSTASQTETVSAPALQGTPSSSANRLSASVVSSTVTSSSSVASSTSSSASVQKPSTSSSTPVQNFAGPNLPSSTRAPPLSTTTPQTIAKIAVQPSPTPSPSPPSTEGSSSPPSADVQIYLQAHNSVRSQHGAADLTWSNDLAAKAQQWANGCQFKHSGGSLGPFGGKCLAVTMISFNNLSP